MLCEIWYCVVPDVGTLTPGYWDVPSVVRGVKWKLVKDLKR